MDVVLLIERCWLQILGKHPFSQPPKGFLIPRPRPCEQAILGRLLARALLLLRLDRRLARRELVGGCAQLELPKPPKLSRGPTCHLKT